MGNGNATRFNSTSTSVNGPVRRHETAADKEKKKFPEIAEDIAKLHDWHLDRGPRANQFGAGLYNPSNDCFLNSVLQLVVHIPQLAQTLISLKDERMCRGRYPCIHCELRKHVSMALDEKAEKAFWAVIPRNILPVIFPSHEDGMQEDAHEMLILLLGALDPPLPKPLDGRELSLAEKSTPIQQIFGGTTKYHYQCIWCGHERANYEDTNHLSLSFPESMKRRTDVISMDSLFHKYFRAEMMYTECEKCKTQTLTKKTTTLLRAPSVLLVHLKRFDEYGRKNRTRVKPAAGLSLWDHANNYSGMDPMGCKRDYSYRLMGIIEHNGTSLERGHYVCAMQGINTQQWFFFNDAAVCPMNLETPDMEPYILCYTKVIRKRGREDVRARRYSAPPSVMGRDRDGRPL